MFGLLDSFGGLPKWLACAAALLMLLFMAFGCSSNMTADEMRARAQVYQDLGLEGKLVFIWGTGHVGGQAFNITGSNGYGEINFEPEITGSLPTVVPTTQPAPE